MPYVYKMIQIPPSIEVNKKQKNTAAATYLQNIVNEYANDGWEFMRVDTIGVEEKPGCLAVLFGSNSRPVTYYVVTFRKNT